jgi:MazG family protein
VEHLQEELGDLLFQVFFHAVLAAEEGWFDMADVARGVHDKLVGRHPHVFGDAVAHTPEQVAARWEVLKQAEKGRTSVFEGIPAALPALALAAKLQRKAESIGVTLPDLAGRLHQVAAAAGRLPASPSASGETLEAAPATIAAVGEALFALADAARRVGVDPESALRTASTRFRAEVEALERRPAGAPPAAAPQAPPAPGPGPDPGAGAGVGSGGHLAAGSVPGGAPRQIEPPTDLNR